MNDVQEKLAQSLTAEGTEMIPYLPYLLQDLWELGSSPEDITELFLKYFDENSKLRVLDLACGKGAVSVKLAKNCGCRIKGIDLLPEFIAYAKVKATEFGVEKFCEFTVGDINEAVELERDYDVVIMGAAGDILGNPGETMEKLKKTIKQGGLIIIDDAYARKEESEIYHTREEWQAYIEKAGLKKIDERFIADDELRAVNDAQQPLIQKRAEELKSKYPDKAPLFNGYIRSQLAECAELENEIVGVLLLLKK